MGVQMMPIELAFPVDPALTGQNPEGDADADAEGDEDADEDADGENDGDGDGDGEMQMHPKHRRQDQIFACKHKLQPVIVSQWRPVESAESLSLCCPSTTPRCTSVWRIHFPCRKLPMTAGRAYGGS